MQYCFFIFYPGTIKNSELLAFKNKKSEVFTQKQNQKEAVSTDLFGSR